MTPPEIRDTLLHQHVRLRGLLGEALELSRRRDAGTATDAVLRLLVGQVRRAFEEHNRYEEAALRPLLAHQDGWGPARVDRMLEEHAGEHRALVACLSTEVVCTTAELVELTEEVDAHMAAEERVFLNVAILPD